MGSLILGAILPYMICVSFSCFFMDGKELINAYNLQNNLAWNNN